MRYSFTFSALLAVAISAPISVPGLPTLPLGDLTSVVGSTEGLTKDLPVRSVGVPSLPAVPDVSGLLSEVEGLASAGDVTKELPVRALPGLSSLPVAVPEIPDVSSVLDITKSLPVRDLPGLGSLPEVPGLEEVEELVKLPVRGLPEIPSVPSADSLLSTVEGAVPAVPALPVRGLLGIDLVDELGSYLTKALDLLLDADADLQKIADAAESLESAAIISSLESVLNQVLAYVEEIASKNTGLSLTQLNPTLGTVNGVVNSCSSKIDGLTAKGLLGDQADSIKAEIKSIVDIVAGLIAI